MALHIVLTCHSNILCCSGALFIKAIRWTPSGSAGFLHFPHLSRVQAVPLADCKDNVIGGVLKVLLHSLTCNQSTTFLGHTFSTLRALVVKVLSLRCLVIVSVSVVAQQAGGGAWGLAVYTNALPATYLLGRLPMRATTIYAYPLTCPGELSCVWHRLCAVWGPVV